MYQSNPIVIELSEVLQLKSLQTRGWSFTLLLTSDWFLEIAITATSIASWPNSVTLDIWKRCLSFKMEYKWKRYCEWEKSWKQGGERWWLIWCHFYCTFVFSTGFEPHWKSLENSLFFHFFWKSLETSGKIWIWDDFEFSFLENSGKCLCLNGKNFSFKKKLFPQPWTCFTYCLDLYSLFLSINGNCTSKTTVCLFSSLCGFDIRRNWKESPIFIITNSWLWIVLT